LSRKISRDPRTRSGLRPCRRTNRHGGDSSGLAICGISFCLLGLPLKAAETCCVEISPRLKNAFISFETAGEISTSFETRNGRLSSASAHAACLRAAQSCIEICDYRFSPRSGARMDLSSKIFGLDTLPLFGHPYRVAFKYGVTRQRGFFALVVNPVNAEAHATFRFLAIAPRSDSDVVIANEIAFCIRYTPFATG
jgi:hypothetical protein